MNELRSKQIMRQFRKFAIAFGAVILLCISMSSINAWALDTSDDDGTKIERPNRPLAVVRKFKADVYIKHEGDEEWSPAKMGAQLFSSDSLRTTEGGFAAVQFMDNSIVKVKPNSILALSGEVRGKDDTSTRLAMEVGEILLNVTKQKSEFEVATPSAVAAVKGTEFGTNVNIDGSSGFYVFEGVVNVRPNNGKGNGVDLVAGMFGNVNSNGDNLEKGEMSDEQRDKMKKSFDEEDSEIKKLELKFINKDGSVRTIEIKYKEKQDQ